MSAQGYLDPGFDPTSDPSIPANIASAITQSVRQATGVAEDTGITGVFFGLWGSALPDVVNNPFFARCLWWDTTNKVLKEYNATSGGWDPIPTPAASISADSLASGSVTLIKLSATGGAAGQFIRVITPLPTTPPYFEFVDLVDAIADGSLSIVKLGIGGADQFLYSDGTTNSWKEVDSAYINSKLVLNSIALTKLIGNPAGAPGTVLGSYYNGSSYVTKWLAGTELADVINAQVPNFGLSLALLSKVGAAAGQVLAFNGATWVPTSLAIPAPFSKAKYVSPNTLNTYVGGAFTQAHGLSAVPSDIEVRLVCVTDDSAATGYVVGDEINIAQAYGASGSNDKPQIGYYANAVSIGVTVKNYAAFLVQNKTTGADSTLTQANWKIKLYVGNIV